MTSVRREKLLQRSLNILSSLGCGKTHHRANLQTPWKFSKRSLPTSRRAKPQNICYFHTMLANGARRWLNEAAARGERLRAQGSARSSRLRAMNNIYSNPTPLRQKFIEYLTLNRKAERTVH